MKHTIILLLAIPMFAFAQTGKKLSNLEQSSFYDDSLNCNLIRQQIADMEEGFNSKSYLKSAQNSTNLVDFTYEYLFNSETDSSFIHKNYFIYNTKNQKVKDSSVIWNNVRNEWFGNLKNEFDSLGNIVYTKQTKWKEKQVYYNSTIINSDTLYSDSTIIPAQYFNSLEKYFYVKNKLGKIVSDSIIYYDQYAKEWYFDRIYRYKLDSVGNKLLSTLFYSYAPKNPNKQEEFTYDANGNILTYSMYDLPYDQMIRLCTNRIMHEYTYDSNKRVTNLLSYYWSFKTNEWKKVSNVEYIYGNNGKLEMKFYSILNSAENGLMQVNKYAYFYDSQNNLKLLAGYIYNKPESAWNLKSKVYYYNNTQVFVKEKPYVSEIQFSIYPNPAKEYVTMSVNNETINSVNIYTTNGQFINSYRLQKGLNTVNVSTFQKGIYIFRVQSPNGIGTSRIIIE